MGNEVGNHVAVEPVVPGADPAHDLHATTEAHAEGGHGGAFPPFDPAGMGGQLLWLAITFGALYLLMSRVALPQIGSILADRKARIDADLAEAETLQKQTDAAVRQYEADLAAARSQSQRIAEETRTALKTDIDMRRKAVEADLSAKMADAEARIKASKTAALTQVDEIAATTAQALVGQLVGSVSEQQALSAVQRAIRE
jgi:F-type H+-transporting ATPase subunit b